MQVSDEILLEWKKCRDKGDIALIRKETTLSVPTIIKAFKGQASQKTILLIDGFFRKKIQNMEKLRNLSI